MAARRSSLEYRIEYQHLSDPEWRSTDLIFESLGVALTQLRQFPSVSKRLVQRRVQAGDWSTVEGIIG